MFKRAKVVMLPTNEKAAPILSYLNDKSIQYFPGENWSNGDLTKRNLYITSDDEIKEGDWFTVELFKIDGTSDGLHIEQANSIEDVWINKGVTLRRHSGNCKKIIATTNSSFKITKEFPHGGYENGEIIPNAPLEVSLPQPSTSFIQKYVEEYNKGNIITDVMVEYENPHYFNHWSDGVKVSKDNTITIRKLKDSWNRDEVIELITKAFKAGYERSHSGYPNTDNHTKPKVGEFINDNL